MTHHGLRAVSDYVIVRPVQIDLPTKGIIIPETAKDRPTHGDVLAVGPGKYEKGVLIPPGIVEGERVVYGRYTGVPYLLGREELVILHASDILAVLVEL